MDVMWLKYPNLKSPDNLYSAIQKIQDNIIDEITKKNTVFKVDGLFQ